MAERSFKKEIEQLKIGEGATFKGEGILAVTKALLQSGVSYVGGYQGAPISHLMDVFSDAEQLLEELGVHFEASASEATAAAMLAASVNYPLRGAVAWKSTVGTNVASDALANVASGGVTGGALIIIGEDYGEGSSIMQERSHAFAMKSQIWLLDPRPNLASMVDAVEKGFQLSEASNTPVMLELRIRACHLYGSFEAKDNISPQFTVKEAIENPTRETERIVLPPANFSHEIEKIKDRWPAAINFIKEHKLNEFLGGMNSDVGIIVQGGIYNTLIRALNQLGLSDIYGETELPIYVLNVTYPLVDSEVIGFCADKKSVLIIEEGQPDFIEQNLNSILRKADIQTKIIGKEVLPQAGEYTGKALFEGVENFIKDHTPTLMHPQKDPDLKKTTSNEDRSYNLDELLNTIPARPAGFCIGCPERPFFTAMKILQKEMGNFHVACDIGCHLFSILPPFNIGNTTMGYGLGAASASAFNVASEKRTISIMGDGGFWHNGLTSGIGNAVFNESDNVFIIVDNGYSAATGGQDILSSLALNNNKSTQHSIAKAVRGVGVKWVREVITYEVTNVVDTLREAVTSKEKGPKVIIARSECMLNKQRRLKPIIRKNIASGKREVQVRYGVDDEICTGDHSCIRLSGCPTLTVKPNPDPLRQDPVTTIEDGCVGCGNCGETAHAAELCPSFYRAELIYNPGWWERSSKKMRQSIIQFLQYKDNKKRQNNAF